MCIWTLEKINCRRVCDSNFKIVTETTDNGNNEFVYAADGTIAPVSNFLAEGTLGIHHCHSKEKRWEGKEEVGERRVPFAKSSINPNDSYDWTDEWEREDNTAPSTRPRNKRLFHFGTWNVVINFIPSSLVEYLSDIQRLNSYKCIHKDNILWL